MSPRATPRDGHAGTGSPPGVADRWRGREAGRRYRDARWRTARAGQRDLVLVRRILERHGTEPSRGGILDAPCGTGRLRPVLDAGEGGYVGVDVSEAMLQATEPRTRLVQGAVERLPFRDDTFDVVVSCRLLHHVQDRGELAALVEELTRVASRLVVASFWDAASLHAWRRRVGLRRSARPEGRRAVSKPVLRRLFEEAGAPIVAFHHSFRFVSQQTFLVASKQARATAAAPRVVRRALDTLPSVSEIGPALGEGSLGGA